MRLRVKEMEAWVGQRLHDFTLGILTNARPWTNSSSVFFILTELETLVSDFGLALWILESSTFGYNVLDVMEPWQCARTTNLVQR